MNLEFEKQLMLKFLEKNFPISRVKHFDKFRRAIILDSGTYILSDEGQHRQLKFQLVVILKKVFYIDDATAKAVLSNFLNLK